MDQEIKKLVEYIMEDLKLLRSNDEKAKDRLGAEFMTLNALCNAHNTLKNKCQED